MTNEEAINVLRHIAGSYGDVSKYYNAICFAISALERDRWISVDERLPERNTDVLVYAIGNADGFWDDQVIAIAQRFLFKFFPSSEGTEEWSSPWRYFHTDYKITHWRPLPEPPKKET